MTHYDEQYQQAKNMLNSEQRDAVETIFGPVLAIAGPGTGKTQVLTLRIAEILQKTDSDPKNILALTFTDAGVAAMRNRLKSFIGTTAYDVCINTFHGFCVEILQRFPEKFLEMRSAETADDLQKIQILQEILQKGKYQWLAPFKSPNCFLQNILGKISTLKREDVSPKDFEQVVIQEKEEFESISQEDLINAKTGKMKGKYQTQKKRLEKWEEFTSIYRQYQSALQERGLLDFDDQILFVLKKLREDTDLLSELQEQYLFILSDEFQDSNGAQLEILELLSGKDPQANLFVVGDDDQSIYRFQGANLENILLFLQKFTEAKVVTLTTNYRSSQEILDIAESSIKNGGERLTKKIPSLKKNLTAFKGLSSIKPQIFSFLHRDAERYFLLKTIQEMLLNPSPDSEAAETKPKPEDIAILVRTNREGQELLHYFEQNGLPAIFAAKSNILSDRHIQHFLDLLRLLATPENILFESPRLVHAEINALFFRVLHAPFWGISPKSIWEQWKKMRTKRESFEEMIMQEESSDLLDKEEVKNPSLDSEQAAITNATSDSERIQSIISLFHRWQQDLKTLSFAESFQKILTESGFLEHILSQNDRLEEIDHINALFSEVKQLSRGNPDFSLREFLEILDLREEFNLSLGTKQAQSQKGAVTILTVHKAKGLEFDTVFVTNLVNGAWGNRRNMDKLALPDRLMKSEKSAEHEQEEERRLFFVAITRAKRQLFLSHASQDESGREKVISRFLEELDFECMKKGESTSFDEAVFERAKAELHFTPVQKNEQEQNVLREMLLPDNFSLSVTALQNYLQCPRKFFYESLLYIPGIKNKHAALGTALHTSLEIFFAEYKRRGILPKYSLAVSTFERAIQQEILSQKDLIDTTEEGKRILKSYFKYYQRLSPPLATEMNFRSHHVFLKKTVPLTGKIDKIEMIDETEKTVRIIDYKTSKKKSENEIRGLTKSSQKTPYAGNIWRQLQFYYLLCTRSTQFSYVPKSFQLDFLLPDEQGHFSESEFFISEEDTLEFQEEILQVWKGIQNLSFLEEKVSCHLEECSFCEMFEQGKNS